MSTDHQEAARPKLVEEFGRSVQRYVQETVRFYEAVADQLGIPTTDLSCLGALYDLGPSTAGDLAARLGLTTGAITRVIDRLVDRGWARRMPDPHDRRRVMVEVEHAGAAEVSPYFAGMALHLERLAGGYTDEQLCFLRDFLRENIEAARIETDRLRREGKAHGTRRSRRSAPSAEQPG